MNLARGVLAKPSYRVTRTLSLYPSWKQIGLSSPQRSYATQNDFNSNPRAGTGRKAVTVINDDGRVHWGDLSIREKAARTTQQSFNFLVVVAGIAMTGAVLTFLYLDIFSSSSKTSQFNRAVDRVKKDVRCIDLLGESKKIIAYGEPTWNKWARSRPIASKVETDKVGTEHFYMHFNIEGPKNKGTVNLHLTKRVGDSEYSYQTLALDVKGQQRIYLENADASKFDKRSSGKMFGVRWW